MTRWAAFLALAAIVAAQTAQADDWGWRHHHRYYYPYGPRAEVIMVYPAPPPPPPPSVVYVPVPQPQPMQVVPTSQPYTDPYGRYCREYQGSVIVGGVAQPSYGTACRQPDGSWQIVSTR